MRNITKLSLMVLCAAACGDNTTADMAGTVDNSVILDMAVTPPDMTVVPDMTSLPDMVCAPGDNTCFGKITKPTPMHATYTLNITITELMGSPPAPVAMATVKVCPVADVACAMPMSTGMTDANGKITITAPSAPFGLGAYLDITEASHVELLQYLYAGPTADTYYATSPALTFPAFTTSLFKLASAVGGVMPDPARGHVTFQAEDCKGMATACAVVAAGNADAMTKTVYVSGGLPKAALTTTDSHGQGVIFNVPPGATTVDATITTKYSSNPVNIRAGAITSLILLPTM